MGARLFGTDGIRGRAGEGWLVPERVSALGRSAGEVLAAGAGGRALLGHDGRRSGPELERALARGLSAAGFECTSGGLITTPGLATVGRRREFEVTAMVSASHNPAEDNGIKFFNVAGDKLADAVEDEIESHLHASYDEDEAWEPGPRPAIDPQIEEEYLNHLLAGASDLKLGGMSLCLDCANGGGSRVGPRLLRRLGAQVLALASEPDGDNINEDSGATQPRALQESVRHHEAAIGIALDGDGDRCILVDEKGGLVHGDGMLTLIARHERELGRLTDPRIVATVMSNRGLHRALREANISVLTVDVGDRQVVEALRREDLSLGGEQSGHIVFGPDNNHIGDGLYTALRVLNVLQTTGRPLSELAAPYEPFPQILINVPVSTKPSLAKLEPVSRLVTAIEDALGEDGRVLLRYSGTEPLARVMVEGPDANWIKARAQELADLIGRELGPGSMAR